MTETSFENSLRKLKIYGNIYFTHLNVIEDMKKVDTGPAAVIATLLISWNRSDEMIHSDSIIFTLLNWKKEVFT